MKNIIIFILCMILISCSNKSNFDYPYVAPIAPTQGAGTGIVPKRIKHKAVFSQNKGKAQDIDIIFSIDNSGSMGSYINKVEKNVEQFLNALDEKNYNYQVGILKSTEQDNGEYLTYPQGFPNNIVRSTATDHVEEIIKNISGVRHMDSGSDERPLWIFSQALADNKNLGTLFRPGTATVFISLSDWNDYLQYTNDQAEVHRELNQITWDLDSVNRYTTGSSGYKPWTLIAIGSPAANPCLNAEESNHWFVEQIALASGGIMGRICDDDYSKIMSDAVQVVFSLLNSFSVASLVANDRKVDESTIKVFVNGKEINNSQVNGYIWNGNNNSISFPGTYVPEENATIEVNFETFWKFK